MEYREEWLARTFVELADTLVADFDLIEFMSVVVERCSELLGSAEVGLALAAARGELRVMASSSERMHSLELIEFQNDEGPVPGLSGSTANRCSTVDSTSADDRWPAFTPLAREAGFQMVHAPADAAPHMT